MRARAAIVTAWLGLGLVAGCSSAPPPPDPAQQRAREAEQQRRFLEEAGREAADELARKAKIALASGTPVVVHYEPTQAIRNETRVYLDVPALVRYTVEKLEATGVVKPSPIPADKGARPKLGRSDLELVGRIGEAKDGSKVVLDLMSPRTRESAATAMRTVSWKGAW